MNKNKPGALLIAALIGAALAGCASESSQALAVPTVASAARPYVGPRTLIAAEQLPDSCLASMKGVPGPTEAFVYEHQIPLDVRSHGAGDDMKMTSARQSQQPQASLTQQQGGALTKTNPYASSTATGTSMPGPS